MLRALLVNTKLTDTEISLHYVYLQCHLGLGTACVLLFYKPAMSQHSSWFPLVAPVLPSVVSCTWCSQPSPSHCLWAPALKLCPLGWIPWRKPRCPPEDKGTSATSFSGLVTSWSRIQHSGCSKRQTQTELCTLFMQIHVQVQSAEAGQYLTNIPREYETRILSPSVGLTQCFNSEYPNESSLLSTSFIK